MRKLLVSVTLAALVTTPVRAADWQTQATDVQPGTFVGARLRLSLGGNTAARPRASLTFAPSLNHMSGAGMARSSIGEGVALNFTPGDRPTLTFAGMRADQALGLKPGQATAYGTMLGLSDGAAIAFGVGATLLIGAGVFYAVATDCADHEDECP